MKLTQTIKDAVTNVIRGRLRTFLTMLGLVVGISSVIALVGLGDGSNSEVEEQIKALGGNIISGYTFEKNLDYEDIGALNKDENFVAVAPSKMIGAKIGSGKEVSKRGSVEATDENYLEARNLSLASGRNLSSVDRKNGSTVCVLGADIAKDFFGTSDAVGNTLKIDGKIFTVVGVLESKGDSVGLLTDNIVLVPFSLLPEFGSSVEIDAFYARAANEDDVESAKTRLNSYLLNEKQMTTGNFIINTQDEMLSAGSSIDETMTILLAGIASISLVVAGIGVMNVMLVSVAERVREIGIKKALGAKRTDILLQFLIEALVISLAGGVCGVLVGLGFGMAAESIEMRFEPSITIIWIAAAASISIGLIFGIFPAYRASRLSPIEALRQE